MPEWQNVMEIFKLLEKSNCRQCNQPTCLAFAAAVFKGQMALSDCPRLDPQTAPSRPAASTAGTDNEIEQAMEQLKARISQVNLEAAARRLDGQYANGRLTLKILGKDFSVDAQGRLSSDIHVHAWVAVPFLNHVLEGKGGDISGEWVPFRELPNGRTWLRLFQQRGEKPLKRVADLYPDLFSDMVDLFNGRPAPKHYQADISLVLHPLPKLPLLICYWKAEEELESDLTLFFDARAEDHLPIENLFGLTTGLVRMFENIARRHGVPMDP